MSRDVKSVEVCIATMNPHLHVTDFLDKLNIQTDAIIGNQCGKYAFSTIDYKGHVIKIIDTDEKGVGLNRNNAWMRTTSDIVLFSDDDMFYYDGYEQTVLRLFNENPKADVIIFNIDENVPRRHKNKKSFYTKKTGYGAVRIAVRRIKAQMHGISFNLHFGGGTHFSHGEDSLFLSYCVKEGLKILVVPESIAMLTEERGSTWFQGYNDKYFFDAGVLQAALKIKFPICRRIGTFILKRRGTSIKSLFDENKLIKNGIDYFRGL